MEYPGGKNQHFQHLLSISFHRGQKAAEAARDICNVYREGVIGERAAQKWLVVNHLHSVGFCRKTQSLGASRA